MVTQLPPKPRGDVAGTWAAIARLHGFRGGLVELRKKVVGVLDDVDGLEGLYLLRLSVFRTSSAAEVDMAVAGVDHAVAQLTQGVRRLERDLQNWQATCDRIRAAQP